MPSHGQFGKSWFDQLCDIARFLPLYSLISIVLLDSADQPNNNFLFGNLLLIRRLYLQNQRLFYKHLVFQTKKAYCWKSTIEIWPNRKSWVITSQISIFDSLPKFANVKPGLFENRKLRIDRNRASFTSNLDCRFSIALPCFLPCKKHGGEGGIRTHGPSFPGQPISSRPRYNHFGTSPPILCRRKKMPA